MIPCVIMPTANQHKKPFYIALAIALITFAIAWPQQQSHNPSPYMYAILFTPTGAGYLAGLYVWSFTNNTTLGYFVGTAVTILGWYLPFAIFMIKNPALAKNQKVVCGLLAMLIWLWPVIFYSISILKA